MIFPYAGGVIDFSITEKERKTPAPQAEQRPMDTDGSAAMICM